MSTNSNNQRRQKLHVVRIFKHFRNGSGSKGILDSFFLVSGGGVGDGPLRKGLGW